MRLVIFIVVAFALVPNAGFGQVSRALKVEQIYSRSGAKAASEDLILKRQGAIVAQRNLEKLVLEAGPAAALDAEIEKARAEADATAAKAKEAADKVLAQAGSDPVPPKYLEALTANIDSMKLAAEQEAASSGRIFLFAAGAGIALSLLAAVSGFLKKAIAAGLISAIAASVGVASKTFAVEEWADFDATVSRQLKGLSIEAKLDRTITEADYDSYVQRLKLIAEKTGPSATKSRAAAADLVDALEAAKLPHRD